MGEPEYRPKIGKIAGALIDTAIEYVTKENAYEKEYCHERDTMNTRVRVNVRTGVLYVIVCVLGA